MAPGFPSPRKVFYRFFAPPGHPAHHASPIPPRVQSITVVVTSRTPASAVSPASYNSRIIYPCGPAIFCIRSVGPRLFPMRQCVSSRFRCGPARPRTLCVPFPLMFRSCALNLLFVPLCRRPCPSNLLLALQPSFPLVVAFVRSRGPSASVDVLFSRFLRPTAATRRYAGSLCIYLSPFRATRTALRCRTRPHSLLVVLGPRFPFLVCMSLVLWPPYPRRFVPARRDVSSTFVDFREYCAATNDFAHPSFSPPFLELRALPFASTHFPISHSSNGLILFRLGGKQRLYLPSVF
ncbi:hypothetical protein SLA2020_420490 [Shorea laevis]